MKTFLFVCCFLNIVRCIDATTNVTTDVKTVYICKSKSATKYHLKADCRGLSTCQYEVIKTTLESATNSNKTLCEWERPSPEVTLPLPAF